MTEKHFKTYTYYTRIRTGEFDIFMFPSTLSCCRFLRTSGSNPKYFSDYGVREFDGVRLSTLEEKHWLDECIKKDTMVPREIAMASFKSTTIDFVHGKWYKATPEANNRSGDTYYGKFLDYQAGCFVASSSRVSGSISDVKYTFNSGYIWELVTDLSEIQHLLPTNHPDKIMKPAPEAIMEVFGKFIIGNIVVSLRTNLPWREEGDMFTILHNSKQDMLYYKPSTHSQDRDDWRLATTKECHAYHNGVKNIKQMDSPKETTKPVVSQFLKDDYIVVLQEVSVSFPKNHVFKQRETASHLRVYKDIRGEANGNNIADISKASLWRYATTQEIMEYDIQNGPVDVTRIGMAKLPTYEPDPVGYVIPSNAKKWAIRRTKDNYHLLNDWANAQPGKSFGHSDNEGWIHSVNYGLMGHSGDGHFHSDKTKHPDHIEITTEQFKRDIMRMNDTTATKTTAFPEFWYLRVTKETKWDAELWRWDGNPMNFTLKMNDVVGMHYKYGKAHNGSSDNSEFGKEISYSEFKANVFSKEERIRLLKVKYPIGSCVVVTKPNTNMNGKLDYCYKIINYGTGEDPVLYYDSNNAIGLRFVEVRRALTSEVNRYEREGNPYDIKSLETSKYEITNGLPKYVKCVDYAKKHNGQLFCTTNPPPRTLIADDTWYHRLVECGRLEDGSFVPVTREEYEAFITKNNKVVLPSYKDKSLGEMCDLCNQMFPIGSVVDFSNNGSDIYTIKEKLYIGSNSYVSYVGLPIVYRQNEDTLRCSLVSKPVKTIEDLPKKAKMSDVSTLVKHQEPIIVNRQKTKRSKLVIINK